MYTYSSAVKSALAEYPGLNLPTHGTRQRRIGSDAMIHGNLAAFDWHAPVPGEITA
jgi:hypothetical protein